ncbi:MAG: TIGR01777 family oxidoreductase [Candidatus Promineifilaceae bacterium]|nr:TIGR01777 family oxidoreductase [Candidatus Promineifilaceae bacterium]
MHVLITGGSGLVGQALTHELLNEGHEVTILSRDPQKYEALNPKVNWVKWDGRASDGWGHLMETVDAVVNLAGASIGGEGLVNIFTQRWSEQNKKRILQSRLDAGQALVAAVAAVENKPAVLIQASAVGYYGPHGAEAIHEKDPAGDDFLAQVCEAWEKSTEPVEDLGVRRVILRTGLILSQEGGILPVMLLPFRLFVGGPVGSGLQEISWIHMRDHIAAMLFLLKDEAAQGAFNLTAPDPVNYKQFSKIVGRVMNRPSFIPVPGFALKLLLGAKSMLVLEGQRVLPSRLLAMGYEFAYSELEPALRELLA